MAVNLEDLMEVTFEEKDAAAAKKYGEAIVSTVECLGFDCKLVGVRQTKEAKERKLQCCNIQFELNPPLNGNSEVDSLASKLSTIVRSSANKDYPTASRPWSWWKMRVLVEILGNKEKLTT